MIVARAKAGLGGTHTEDALAPTGQGLALAPRLAVTVLIIELFGFASEDLKEAMQKSGVIGSPSIRFAAAA